MGQTVNAERRERLLLLAGQSHQVIAITEKILKRAETLETAGFDSYDAIHLASAEQAKVDVFLTTDDNIQKVAKRSKEALPFLIENSVRLASRLSNNANPKQNERKPLSNGDEGFFIQKITSILMF